MRKHRRKRQLSSQDRVFLSPDEALRAIRSDFKQYPPQTRLFLELCPLVLKSGRPVINDSRNNAIWIKTPAARRRRMKKISPRELGEVLLKSLASQRPDLDELAGICSRVFNTAAYPGKDESGKREGIWLETGMANFECQQCGRCCSNLDYRFELTETDYRLWEELGRTDILEWVAVFRRKGKIRSYAIWVMPGSRNYAPACPWLEKKAGSEKWECRIHSVKPQVCREYPGSRKHAQMTGCPAFKKPAARPSGFSAVG